MGFDRRSPYRVVLVPADGMDPLPGYGLKVLEAETLAGHFDSSSAILNDGARVGDYWDVTGTEVPTLFVSVTCTEPTLIASSLTSKTWV